MKVASVDIGTNTCLLLVCEVQHGRVTQVFHDESRAVRLGEGVNKNRRFLPQALERLEACLRDYRRIGQTLGAEVWGGVATSAARDAQNRSDFEAVCNRHHIPVQVISGAKEAELTFRGLASDREDQDGLAGIDIGGGSTEIVFRRGDAIKGRSFDVGCLRLKEMFVTADPIVRSERLQMREFVGETISEFRLDQVRELIAVAGTPTTLAAMEMQIDFDPEKINGLKLGRPQIQKWEEKLSAMTIDERSRVRGLDLGRSDVIVPGLIILDECAKRLGFDSITVSVRGIRYGLALELAV